MSLTTESSLPVIQFGNWYGQDSNSRSNGVSVTSCQCTKHLNTFYSASTNVSIVLVFFNKGTPRAWWTSKYENECSKASSRRAQNEAMDPPCHRNEREAPEWSPHLRSMCSCALRSKQRLRIFGAASDVLARVICLPPKSKRDELWRQANAKNPQDFVRVRLG